MAMYIRATSQKLSLLLVFCGCAFCGCSQTPTTTSTGITFHQLSKNQKMKGTIIIITLFFYGSAYAQSSDKQPKAEVEPYVLEDIILSVIETIRGSLPDPLALELDETLDLNSALINGSIHIVNPNITGITGFTIPNVNLALIGLKLNLTLSFPSIELLTTYSIDDLLLLTILPIYGEGLASIRIEGLEISISTGVSTTGGIQLNGLRLHIGLNSVNVVLDGLLYDANFSSFASSLITSLADGIIVPYLNTNADAISDTVSPIIQDLINGILSSGNETPTTETTTNKDFTEITDTTPE